MPGAKSISFLLGAGFSKPADYPLAFELGDRLASLGDSDFSIETDGTAHFTHGVPGPNHGHTNPEEREFFVRLISHYRERVTGSGTGFDYEKFVDWLRDLQTKRANDPRVSAIATELEKDLDLLFWDCEVALSQLIGRTLGKRFPERHLGRGLPFTHAKFLDLAAMFREDYVQHFHSLNHDLFFESLSSTDAMKGELADGFSESGSPFYGELWRKLDEPNERGHISNNVRLARFADRFDSRFNLYKLHGSVDQYQCGDRTVRVPWGVGPNNIKEEVGRGVDRRYERVAGLWAPAFLSGTTSKILQYGRTQYSKSMFDHFIANLENSKFLITVGYGFRDEKINEFISRHFLDRTGATMLIVDVREPALPPEFANRYEFFEGGVTDFDLERLQRSVSLQ